MLQPIDEVGVQNNRPTPHFSKNETSAAVLHVSSGARNDAHVAQLAEAIRKFPAWTRSVNFGWFLMCAQGRVSSHEHRSVRG